MKNLVALEQEIENLKNSVNVYLTELRNLAEKYEIDVINYSYHLYLDVNINLIFKNGQFYKNGNKELNIYDSFQICCEIERMFNEKFGEKSEEILNSINSKKPDFSLIAIIAKKINNNLWNNTKGVKKYHLKTPIKYYNETCIVNTVYFTSDGIFIFCDFNDTNSYSENRICILFELETSLQILKEIEK